MLLGAGLGLNFPRDQRVESWHFARVTTSDAIRLLDQFRAGQVTRDSVVQAFQAAPVADLGFAQVDTHRALRRGFPEVIFGAGKTPDQIVRIASKLVELDQRVLVTRVTEEHARVFLAEFKQATHHEMARCLTLEVQPLPKRPGDNRRRLCRNQRFAGGR